MSNDNRHVELISAPCPLCANRDIEEIWRHEQGIANGICRRCGHVYLTRQYPEAVIAASYQEYRQHYPEAYLRDEANPLFQIAAQRGDALRTYFPHGTPGSLLEVGCGYGHFLKQFPDCPLRVGVEPSHDQATFARDSFGLELIAEGTFDDYLATDSGAMTGRFDVACSFHVLEHLLAPVNFIKQVRDQLRPDGYLLLALPDLFTLSPDLIELYFIYRNWHIHSFSAASVGNLLQNNGFEVVLCCEEAPTAMLRSSFLVLARRVDMKIASKGAAVDAVVANRAAAQRFHAALEERLARVRGAFAQWRDTQKRCAIYGGGIHTKALLELTGIDRTAVALIIDDDPAKAGQSLAGIPIVPFPEVRSHAIDVIVVSSLASEAIILERLSSGSLPPGIELTGIYRDLMKGDDVS